MALRMRPPHAETEKLDNRARHADLFFDAGTSVLWAIAASTRRAGAAPGAVCQAWQGNLARAWEGQTSL